VISHAPIVRDEQRAFTERGAAKYVGRSVYFMRDCRIGRAGVPGPAYIKVGRSVAYLREDLDAWLDSFKESNSYVTSEPKT